MIIDRSIWLRGEGSYVSFLLRRSDNKMCCVGIHLHEDRGFSKVELIDTRLAEQHLDPREVSGSWLSQSWLVGQGWGWHETDLLTTGLINHLYEINDYTHIEEDVREAQVEGWFAIFINTIVLFRN